jgi:hypothetical protein
MLIRRVKEPIPQRSFVVPGSTPVISFGNLYTARTVSIGINPSVDEFMTRHKPRRLLPGNKKRLVDLELLGLGPEEELDDQHADRVIEGCFNYFQVNPYSWFNKLEKYVINPSGASYFDGSAAHLDLVQWATDPVWQNIPNSNIATDLIEADKEFLFELLNCGDYEEILLNGATVVDTVLKLGLFDLCEVGKINYPTGSSKLLLGQFRNTRVRATTLNIPSARGLEGPQKFAKWLRETNQQNLEHLDLLSPIVLKIDK